MMDIGGWLRSLGLGQYEAAFRDNEIDSAVLPSLTVDDLKELGVILVGHRRKILTAIAELHAGPTTNPLTASVVERRQLTCMFGDLVGSTALSARLDPEDMRQVILAYQDACSGVVARYDGFVARFFGDGILAYFGFPHAHEDDAARAVHVGLEIAEAVAGLQTRARQKLAARVGIATGLVVVGDLVGEGSAQEQAVVGDTPNLAARLQGLADAGGVVVSAATRRLLGDRFRLRNLGKHVVKGLAEPVEAWAALGVSESESRFEAAHPARLIGLVGRETESGELIAHQRRAWAGQGQTVQIFGEAGIGKSRISAWLADQVADTPHTKLRYQCSPYHRDSALHPFIQQFERAAGIAPQEDPVAKLEKLEQALGLAGDRMNEVAPLVASMLSIPFGHRYPPLSLSAAQQRHQTLSALLDQIEDLAGKQPVLMLFEDAHWADATSLEVLDLAIERVRRLPALLLVTYRPEFDPPWKGLPDVAEIVLQRLDRADAETLVERVAGGRKLPAEVLVQIVAKTDGVPLFIEELTKNVLESGLLRADGESWRLDGPLPPLAIPSTLQDSLMSRLDRLAAVKEIAQVGAAIGREFSYPLLRAVADRSEATLRAALAQLEDSELVFRSGEPPVAQYTFKHALVQDTAYESLLKSRRQILHRRIAEALRDKFADVVDAEPELLAHHFTRAGLVEPAIEYWGRAGDLALRRSAFKEAIAHLRKAIEMTEAAGAADEEWTNRRLKLQVAFGAANMYAQGHGAPETAAAFERVRELAREDEDIAERFTANFGLWVGTNVRGELGAMRDLAESLLRDARRPKSKEACVAHSVNAATHFFQGEFVATREHAERALAAFDRERDRDLGFPFGQGAGISAAIYSALALWQLGEFELAERHARDMLDLTAESTQHSNVAFGLLHAAWFESIKRNPVGVARFAADGLKVAQEHNLSLWANAAPLFQSWSEARLGDERVGLAKMRRSKANWREQGLNTNVPLFETLSAEVECELGEIEAATASIVLALHESARTGQRWFEAETYRIRGQILLRQNPADPAPAEQSLLAAIAIAKGQGSRSFELRAALVLAGLYRTTGRDFDAQAVLRPALAGFSPTPMFPEIAEAQALLAAADAAANL
jgi:predicted ATPase/class 3 adenylate cyclase